MTDEKIARKLERYFESGSRKAFAKKRFLEEAEQSQCSTVRFCVRLSAMTRNSLAAFCFLLAFTHGAVAQTNPVGHDLNALSGRDVRVGVYTSIRPDCTSGPLPAIRLAAAPAHGTVSVKRATLKATNVKQCLAIEVPAFVAFYRATQNYIGADDFELEITFAAGRKELQHVHVHVGNDAGGGQGI